jgi:hypothetical protein
MWALNSLVLIFIQFIQHHFFWILIIILQGVLKGMAPGEFPVTLASKNMQLVVSNVLVSGLNNAVLSTPSTAAQSFYGIIPPKLALGPNGLSSCYSTATGYAELSLLRWGNNPYINSQAIQAPLMRFSTQLTKPKNTTKVLLDRGVIPLKGVPAYTISLQFSTTQAFNFTAGIRGLRKVNFTLPACTIYNGVKYVACLGCNISSYTNHNVTYGCFDITQLCPSTLVNVKRNLQSSKDSGTDSSSKSESVEAASTYGVLLNSLAAELSSTLSSNPFALDLSKAVAILSFMGALIGFIVISFILLLRWDYREKVGKKSLFSRAIHTNDTS